ncbi:TetR/AcrR family transcriptional regulator [Inquilinus sp. YAF38]|uniref:TetR/AcrR family transcriptional regulator n=1 Tax=Inquilinus sp. YAF38 TaxID=3233084 RepID=UPI003F8E56B5
MVLKNAGEPKGRGRPRDYDPQAALQRALERFWQSGYSGTSLTDICDATGMNRPSLYAAFSDKHTLYLKALDRYWSLAFTAMREALADGDQALEEALLRAFDGQLSLYFSGDGLPLGCFAVGTATTEAVEDAEIRRSLIQGIRALDADFEARFRLARKRGELASDADPAALAVLASAMLHTIAIRARAGVPRAELRDMARMAVNVICGGPSRQG